MFGGVRVEKEGGGQGHNPARVKINRLKQLPKEKEVEKKIKQKWIGQNI